ncbi:putative 1-phosphatidylinositol-3-phosphate 5-kinase FAB1C [Dichanthelium oligosanthes]|uniref:1-phosphatidylinositol-3-phosphate 5-kinase n=1 Tax=Dichanthelium oligosanthes TaxID=888268 RepID=A0A1E5V795_9POAL|nr:putative 1-phosphatidylinositol-3-phosphate 5-kinase FAB1C [Dichanthelium oligosanthes]
MADCGGLGGRHINGGRGGAVEQRESCENGPPVSPPERVSTPPAQRMAAWRRMSSPGPLRCSTPRSVGYEDGEDSDRYFSPQNEFSQDTSDTDSVSTSISRMYTFRLGTSSPLDSPIKQLGVRDTSPPSRRGAHSPSYPWNSGRVSDDVDSSFMNSPRRDDEQNKDVVPPVDFESRHIWYPPPPQDEGDDLENGFVKYDDDDDNDVSDGKVFGDVNHGYGDDDDDDDLLATKGKHNIAHKEFLRNALHGHFRALVSQLLQGNGIDPVDGWSDIVASLAWQAATFVRPDTSKGGSMDPTDYVKIKCVASGNPNDSSFIKGVVCSKNVKHKRMVSKHENPRLLLLGGALEHQKVTNKLASINSILEQEKEYLKNAVAKIEAQHPHVLLVEKSVPLDAQQLLAKDISLVLNVKRSLLERISHCTGAQIASSIENVTSTMVGHCQTFWIERVTECSSPKISNKKTVKTLMFFDGCPRRLGCTVMLKLLNCISKITFIQYYCQLSGPNITGSVILLFSSLFYIGDVLCIILLRGKSYEELKKVKLAVQFALFAAYHLSLETSYLADEGASFPKVPSDLQLEKQNFSLSHCQQNLNEFQTINERTSGNGCIMPCLDGSSASESHSRADLIHAEYVESHSRAESSQDDYTGGTIDVYPYSTKASMYDDCIPPVGLTVQTCARKRIVADHNGHRDEAVGRMLKVESDLDNGWNHISDEDRVSIRDHSENHNEYFPTSDNPQSILVSLSIACPLRGIVCKQSQLFRIKFYGTFDKPLGRYFREDLFVQTSCCESCKEPAESHVRCYTHQQGSLTISVRTLASVKLPGEHDGKVWMWHRLGSMVAVFHYSPVDILSVNLPPSVLDFAYPTTQDWVIKEAADVAARKEHLYREIVAKLDYIEQIIKAQNVTMKAGLYRHVADLKELVKVECKKYDVLSGFSNIGNLQTFEPTVDVLELNHLRRELVRDIHMWDRRLYMMHSLTKENCHTVPTDAQCAEKLTESLLEEQNDVVSGKHGTIKNSIEQTQPSTLELATDSAKPVPAIEQNNTSGSHLGLKTNIAADVSLHSGSAGISSALAPCEIQSEGMVADELKAEKMLQKSQSSASNLSDRIDLAWTGSGQFVIDPSQCSMETVPVIPVALRDDPAYQKVIAPIRIKSFDSAVSSRNRLSPVDDSNASIRRSYSQRPPKAIERTGKARSPTFMNNLSLFGMVDGEGRLLLSQNDSDVVVPIYDDEPSSMIAHAMTVPEYHRFLLPLMDENNEFSELNYVAHKSSRSSFDGSTRSYGSDQPQAITGNDSKDNHLTVSFEDEDSYSVDKAKFAVTCYFAKQFDAIRRKCCPDELDYIRSLSRCKRWSAQGGKSNVYFAKTLDDRFVIKQVTRTELDSFEDYADEYFKYLTESVSSGSPTCLTKILGLYQIIAKNLRDGKELKMDVMVMENLFFKRKVSRIYDLKGSLRSRYNPDTSGNNKVLLDLNLLETLHTKPIFLGSKAKRRLERAVWNDTSFLASVDVMDYSLLVGIDEERKELVMGIIDYLRQYTWDKQLETWVKASGFLGGSKDVLPTIISPDQYKKRFRKAMSKYFLTLPDQWSP